MAAENSGGSFSIVEHSYLSGALIPPHVHAAADQVTWRLDPGALDKIGQRHATRFLIDWVPKLAHRAAGRGGLPADPHR